jgi:membrane associated rhomboid family serine protease
MLYLWVFGDNLENVMGHKKYLFFYLLTGLIASLSHVFLASLLDKDLLIPSLGASGAISGVLGGYLVLFPQKPGEGVGNCSIHACSGFHYARSLDSLTIVQWMGKPGGRRRREWLMQPYRGFFAGMLLVKFFVNKVRVQARQDQNSGDTSNKFSANARHCTIS